MPDNRKIPENYIKQVYAGWMGKIIGVRHGANIEGWSYERIKRTFGEITTYPYNFKNFAADDDTNGPMFFVRALEDFTYSRDITPEQMGLTVLNYVPDGHSFFWWGGYGKSTEHTAYSNLKAHIMAPQSGSIAQNGKEVAEQIGGQIFIDVWGFICPGNPGLASEYAEKMASVTHDGNGIYGARFVAACIAQAFIEKDIEKVIETGLSVIPEDSEYSLMVKEVIKFYHNNPENWRNAFNFVRDNYGYHLYPGACHIIPNSAVMILSMMYGRGDFSRTINICNMCGWDTDCNVGNVGAILGIMVGLEGIDKEWIEPINDFICASSVIGSLNITDIPRLVSYTANLGYKIAGEPIPKKWEEIFTSRNHHFHFELPGSTHAFRVHNKVDNMRVLLKNTMEFAHSGDRCLKIIIPKAQLGEETKVYHKTYYTPEEFDDSRYDPDFSPILYPGQTVETWIMLPPDEDVEIACTIYIKERNLNQYYYGQKIILKSGVWMKLEYKIPSVPNMLIMEAGIEFTPVNNLKSNDEVSYSVYLDDMKFVGNAKYSVDFSKERMEKWNVLHQAVSQMTSLRGLWRLEDGELSGSYCNESAESYTGYYYWRDYNFEAEIIPKLGEYHNINFRVQGGIRSYAVGLAPEGKVVLYKNCNGYSELASANLEWDLDKNYKIKINAKQNKFIVYVDGVELLSCTDENSPYLYGQIGFSNFRGSHTHYGSFSINVF